MKTAEKPNIRILIKFRHQADVNLVNMVSRKILLYIPKKPTTNQN